MHTPKDRPILEAALESTEVVVDAITHGDVLAEIPIIGTAFKICRAADAIRDKTFSAKLTCFAKGLDQISENAKEELKRKSSSSPEELRKVGETLFMVLERLTDLEKPLLLSYIFLAYLDGILTSAELRRCAQAIDASFNDDLQEMLTAKDISEKSEQPWMQHLAVSGLTLVVGGKTYGDIGRIYYELTSLGHKLRNAYFHGRKPQN